MGEAGDVRDGDGDESKRVENGAESGPLWERFEADAGPLRGLNEAGARPERGRDKSAIEPDDDLLDDFEDEDDLEAPELRPVLESLYDFLRDPLGEAATTGEARAEREVAAEPLRAPRVRRSGGPSRRRLRRWGEAARRAAMEEIASGGVQGRRSLRAVREGFPMSQRELADRTRLSRATISEIEQGKRRPQPRTMRLLAEVLKVRVGEIEWG